MHAIARLVTMALLIGASSAWADYSENWDAGGNDWMYWAADPISPARLGGDNEPMDWSATGGYGNSGYVSAPLGSLFITWDRYWPAYQAPPSVDPVSLNGQVLRVHGNDLATSNLPDNCLRAFIGEWISDTEYVFFAHNTPLSFGRNSWDVVGEAIVGGDPDWHDIVRVGSTKTASDLYNNPQQWGIVIEGLGGIGIGEQPTGTLGFDELLIEDGPVYWPGNGHYYEAVDVPEGVTWEDADAAARAAWDGTGTLATITSPQKNEFVASLVTAAEFWTDVEYGPWLGGYQTPGSPEPGGGWEWLTGEEFYDYTKWAVEEPNDGGGQWSEDKLHFIRKSGETGDFPWNDAASLDAAPMLGYIIEWDHNPIPEPATLSLLVLGALALMRPKRK